mgnify:CR=1 FL=1
MSVAAAAVEMPAGAVQRVEALPEALLAIPDRIFGAFDPLPAPTVVGWSEEPSLLRGHREKLARAIVALQPPRQK